MILRPEIPSKPNVLGLPTHNWTKYAIKPILWIIIALIVIAVIAYLVRRSQASKA
jgi:hypothetical protein